MTPVDRIAELFASAGASDYLGEPVTVSEHLRQAGALAAASGAPAALVAAALLHDVGHLHDAVPSGDAGYSHGVGHLRESADRPTTSGAELMAGRDNRHGEAGAAWLAPWFPPAVTEPVRLHVAAKRYLCAVEPDYFGRLSEASVYTLSVQGGPMTGGEARAFESQPYAADAVAVRRWDDLAKDPAVTAPAFGTFRPLLTSLLTA
jgi:gamma-butyrobetaine dioxygenase